MKYRGLSAQRRQYLAHLLAGEKVAITINWAAQRLQWSPEKARAFLSSLNRSGWLKLIKPGLYVPVPMSVQDSTSTTENSSLLVPYLFEESYVSAFSAAAFWDLTDQLFLKTWVMTTKAVRQKEVQYAEHTYRLRHIAPSYLFGIHKAIVGQDLLYISDPHKTVIDFANFVDEYGLQGFIDTLSAYTHSAHKNLSVLLDYATRAGNRTIFKRLGFMLEKLLPQETTIIDQCLKQASTNVSSLAPSLSCDVYIPKWRLKVPKHMIDQQ